MSKLFDCTSKRRFNGFAYRISEKKLTNVIHKRNNSFFKVSIGLHSPNKLHLRAQIHGTMKHSVCKKP